MANSIQLIEKYGAQNLDKIFVMESVTGILENRTGVPLKPVEHDAKTVYLPDIVMDGLGDYDMNNGFPDGDISLNWIPYRCEMDRGRGFSIDSVENQESAGIVAANLMAEFLRTKVIPEVDAYRLSKLYANAVAENIKFESITDNNIIKKFNSVIKYYIDNEIALNNLVIYVSSDIDEKIRNTTELQKQITQQDYRVGDLTFKVRSYEGMPIIVVPRTRFKSAYDFGANGFTPATDAVDLNFMVVHTNAALPYKKHQAIRVFAPEVNQKKDAWLFQYRLYHDLITPKNKQKGIYVSAVPKSTG